ncbi:MAG: VTT domain-containing protein [Chromatiaceae bacterium]
MKQAPRLLLALALAAGIALALRYRAHLDTAALSAWVATAGLAGPLVFMGIYAVATVFFLPGSLLTLTGGALFGPLWGTLYNLVGATLGAGLAFLVARYLAADWVQARAGGILKRLVTGVEAEGWRFVAFTRLVPVFPFNLLNYALGLTRIPFLHYLIATSVCMVPGALAYTWLGYAGREAASGGEALIQKGLIALALLAALAFLPRLVARLRQSAWLQVDQVKTRLESDEPLLILDVRTAADFDGEQGHLPGALNLPLEDLAARLEELGSDPERPIALFCRTDRRSAKAAAILARRGFAQAHVVQDGMTAWLDRGWPVNGRSQSSQPE